MRRTEQSASTRVVGVKTTDRGMRLFQFVLRVGRVWAMAAGPEGPKAIIDMPPAWRAHKLQCFKLRRIAVRITSVSDTQQLLRCCVLS